MNMSGMITAMRTSETMVQNLAGCLFRTEGVDSTYIVSECARITAVPLMKSGIPSTML